MKSIYLLLLVSFLAFHSKAQSVYGYDLDSMEIFMNENPDIHPEIGKRFIQNDTSLTPFDHLFLYYGEAFTENYAPYGDAATRNAFEALLEEKKYEAAEKLMQTKIRNQPSCTSCYFDLGVVYFYLQDTLLSDFYFEKYRDLLSVPFFSGTGLSADSAFIVTFINDEYLIIRELGYDVIGQSLHTIDGKNFDILKAKKVGSEKIIEFYFNIDLPFGKGLMQFSEPKQEKKKKRKKDRKRKN